VVPLLKIAWFLKVWFFMYLSFFTLILINHHACYQL